MGSMFLRDNLYADLVPALVGDDGPQDWQLDAWCPPTPPSPLGAWTGPPPRSSA
ncbi:MAG TPA: hypothetical protein VGR26_00760 [Acidimicrobiales bacterium]|nr:hypothetical protein [Acidimicrobiales bacterium]